MIHYLGFDSFLNAVTLVQYFLSSFLMFANVLALVPGTREIGFLSTQSSNARQIALPIS
jgi:cytochrome c oxidase assembly factor CtaG